MGSSELDAPSFVPLWHKVIGIKAHCLDGLNTRLLGWLAKARLPLLSPFFLKWGWEPPAQCQHAMT